MLTANELSDFAPAALSSSGSQKLLALLRKRLRQLLGATLGLAAWLAVVAGGFAIWWVSSLNGLPDIGDPFDVSTIRGLTIADDENALALLRRAQEKLTPVPELPQSVRVAAP